MSVDPTTLTPICWQSRLAALRSNGAGDDDDRVVEARAALAYWRCRRVLDTEAAALPLTYSAALASILLTDKALT